MARPKKQEVSVSYVNHQGAVAAEEKVKIFSLRLGDVQLSDGQVLKYQEPIDVAVSIADYLEKSFKGLIRRL
jgi:hypothetical protein